MKKFKILMQEVLQKEVSIYADSEEEALEQLQQEYEAGEYILLDDNSLGVTFNVISEEPTDWISEMEDEED